MTRLAHRPFDQLKYQYAAYCDNAYDADGIASLFTASRTPVHLVGGFRALNRSSPSGGVA